MSHAYRMKVRDILFAVLFVAYIIKIIFAHFSKTIISKNLWLLKIEEKV